MRKKDFVKIVYLITLFIVLTLISSVSNASEIVKVAEESSFDIQAETDKIQYNTYHGGSFENANPPEIRMFLDKDNKLNYVYYDDTYIYIQKMDSQDRVSGDCIKIQKRLQYFGNITYDSNGNYYIITGKNSSGTTDAQIDISKYSSNGTYISSFTKTCDRNVFHCGGCSMAIDNNGILLVNYARLETSGHQSNRILYIDITTMTEPDKYKDYSNVSHAMFQDVIKLSSNNFLILNQGDGYNRGYTLGYLYKIKDGYWVQKRSVPFHFREGAAQEFGYNNTFAVYGSLVELDTGVALIASSEKTLSMDPAKTKIDSEPNNLFIQIIKKDALANGIEDASSYVTSGPARVAEGTEHISQSSGNTKYFVKEGTTDYGVKWLTNYTKDFTIWNAKGVKIDNNRIAIFYEKDPYDDASVLDDRNNLYYIIVDNNGNIVQTETLVEYGSLPGNEQLVYRNGFVYFVNTNNTNTIRTYKIEIGKYTEKVDPVYPISITVDKSEFTGFVGDKVQLNLTYNPLNSTEKNVIWDSEDKNVATVTQDGLVTLTGAGETKIFATLTNGNKAYCKIKSLNTNVEIEFTDDIYIAFIQGSIFYLNNKVRAVGNGEIDKSKIIFTLSDTNAGTIDSNTIFTPNESYKDKKITVTANYFGNTATASIRIAGKSSYTAYFNLKTDNDDPIELNETKDVILYQKNGEYDVYKSLAEMDIIYDSENLAIDKLEPLSTYVNIEKTSEGTIHVTYDTGKDFIQMNNLEMAKITFKSIVNKDTSNLIDITNIKTKYRYNSESYSLALKDKLVTINTKKESHPLQSISLDKTSFSLEKGNSSSLTVIYNPSNTTDDKTVTWSSSNTNVATVTNGIVSAVGEGTATITAKVGTKEATCKVTVTLPRVPLESIKLNIYSISMLQGETTKLIVTYNPTNTTDDKTITWTSSNQSVATVSDGTVTAIAKGTAVITAKVGTKQASCVVTVSEPVYPLQSISLNITNLTLTIGQTAKLRVIYNPSNTTDDKTVTWYSSKQNVATVSDGKVTAVANGTTTITAKVGNKQASCRVAVKEESYPLQSISLDKTELDLIIGNSNKLTVTYNPTNTTDDKTVIWSSSNQSVATVSDGTVTAIAKGTATITAKVGTKEATCIVTVNEQQYPLISISLNKTSLNIEEDSTSKLEVTYNPTNTTDSKEVKWTSSDTNVATVDKNGNVKGINEGTAIITAKVGSKSAECKVTVEYNLPFKDVPKKSWFYSGVKFTYKNGMFKGYTETEFAPMDKVTRGQLVTVLYRFENEPNVSHIANKFTDVKEGKYYTNAVKWAAEIGLVKGYGGTSEFGPNDPILRQDLAIVLRKYAEYKGKDFTTTTDISYFADYNKVKGGYAEDALKWAVAKGIISGNLLPDGNKEISPFDNATRAEIAAMLMRFIINFKLK